MVGKGSCKGGGGGEGDMKRDGVEAQQSRASGTTLPSMDCEPAGWFFFTVVWCITGRLTRNRFYCGAMLGTCSAVSCGGLGNRHSHERVRDPLSGVSLHST